jgi:ABC-type glycerol-3-phosphate transport system permease component
MNRDTIAPELAPLQRAAPARPAPAGRARAAPRLEPGAHRRLRLPVLRRAVLPAAAVRHDRDLAQADGRDPPGRHLRAAACADLEPWRQAWSGVCTGAACEGIRTGFWNSVAIAVPSTILPILLGAVNGYALSFWRPRGANVLFGS